RLRMDRQPVSLADVGASGESDPPIDDQNLAMISQIGVPQPTPQPGRQETRGGQTRSEHLSHHIWPAVFRSDVVNQHPDLNAASLSRDQSIEKGSACSIVIEDIAQ